MKRIFNTFLVLSLVVLSTTSFEVLAQQDAQFTQYMYNTLSINPAYAGSRGGLSIIGLHRSQWVGLEGTPETQTFSIHSPVGESERVGLGLNVQNDNIFITNETFVNGNFSYSIPVGVGRKLSFGLRAGVHLLDVNYSEASAFNITDPLLSANIDNRFSPQVGVGLWYSTSNFYAGFSAPNLLETEHFDGSQNTNDANATFLARERINYFLTAGYVFDITQDFKFKPAGLVKWVDGAPLQVDVTANALLYDTLTLGVAYRWSAAFSALVGVNLSDSLMLGLAYDRETTDLQPFNDGSFEIFLRYEVLKRNKKGLVSPRFF